MLFLLYTLYVPPAALRKIPALDGIAAASRTAAMVCLVKFGAPVCGANEMPGVSMTALCADPVCREHLIGRPHPERPERFDVVLEALPKERMLRLESRSATEDELLLCHTPAYLRAARHDIESGYRHLSTGDTDIDGRSWEAAVHAAGAALNAVDAVMTGRAGNAFCVVRPPGHHANAGRGMGFCVFNNVALAARYAQRQHGAERVLIVDWDVHHGNGTQDIFYADPSVFFFSTHQWPLYPGTGRADETGEGAGTGATMNFPFPAGSGRAEILGAVENSLMPAAERFRPDLVLISAGFDSRIGDLLGNFTLTDQDFSDLTLRVMELAARHAGGRVVSLLEGGYSLPGLASAAAAHVETLMASPA
ncbi:MAG TPA: histone deacetylase [Bryobacteraceae bacterium]|jgi:acetoin utilization deacetylase AcuC-like enzyme|nr:histone deacetylase [Bryobacteraceae bacterium]